MKIKIISFFIIFLLISLSCRNDLKERFIGMWSIDQIRSSNQEWQDLLTNIIVFKNNEICLMPPTINDKEGQYTWKLLDGDSVIILNKPTIQNKFDGVYHYEFFEDKKNKLLKLTLESKEITLICSKALHNFNKDRDF